MSLLKEVQNTLCFNSCDGEGRVTAQTGNAPYTYNWDNGSTNQTAQGLCIGLYRVTVSDAYGCMDTTHITVTSPTILEYTFNTDPVSCFGLSDGSATVSVSGGVTPYTYNWSDGNNSETNIGITASTYSLTITDANNCEIIEENIVVEQPEQIFATLYGEHTVTGESWICIGESETLHSSVTGGAGPYTLAWNTGATTDQIEVSPQVTTTYTAIAEDSKGCFSFEQSVIVHVYDPISIETNANKLEICKGELIKFSIYASGGNGEYLYSLTSLAGTQSILDTVTISPEQTQDFIITAMDNCNSPLDENTIRITVNPTPEASFNANIGSGCQPLQVEFLNNSINDNESYLWEFGNSTTEGDISFEKNPIHIFNNSGSYDIKLTVTSDKNCIAEITKPQHINVFPKPIANFEDKGLIKSVIHPTIYFNNTSELAQFYQWNFSNLDTTSQVSPEYTFPNTVENYEIELIAFTNYNCSDTISRNVKIVEEITFYTPTAFSPDGDGRNEIFIIKGNGIIADGFSMLIYDRWGMEVFSSNDINKGWDGKGPNGDLVKPGIYTWFITFKDSHRVSYQKQGIITLVN